jgi:hypothetical protein
MAQSYTVKRGAGVALGHLLLRLWFQRTGGLLNEI